MPQPPDITSVANTTFAAGVAGSFTVTATGYPAPTFSATGLPTWANLTSATGVLSGTPPAAESGPITIALTAANTALPNATQVFTLNVQPQLTFSQWEVQPAFFTTAQGNNPLISGPTVAFKADGITNLFKYLYNVNPSRTMTSADRAALPVFNVAPDGDLTLIFREYLLKTGITLTVQTSSTLQTWTNASEATTPTAGSYTLLPTGSIDPNTGDPYIEIDFKPTSALSMQFIRFNVTTP